MTFRTRMICASMLITAMYLMTWGRPWFDAIVPPDSPVMQIAEPLFFGVVIVLFGLLLARWGLKQMYGAITQTRLRCDECSGSGVGTTRYVKVDDFDIYNRYVGSRQVQTSDCPSCDGAGSTATGYFQQGLIGSGAGGVAVVFGLLMLGNLRAPPGLPKLDALKPGGLLRSTSETSLPPEVSTAVTPGKNSQAAIVLTGRETESSGQIWQIQATLQQNGTQVQGELKFKLIKPGRGSYQAHRVNSTAIMDVVGTFDGMHLALSGTRVSDPSLIGVSRYELKIDKAKKTFSGTLPNGGGVLKGTVKFTASK